MSISSRTKSDKHVPQKTLCDHTTAPFLEHRKKRPLRASLGPPAVCRDGLTRSENSCSDVNHRSTKMITHTENILERNQRTNFPWSVTRTNLIRVGVLFHYGLYAWWVGKYALQHAPRTVMYEENLLQTCRSRSSVCHRVRRRQDVTWDVMTWRDLTWHDVTWDEMTWHEMRWHDMKVGTPLLRLPCSGANHSYDPLLIQLFIRYNLDFESFSHSSYKWHVGQGGVCVQTQQKRSPKSLFQTTGKTKVSVADEGQVSVVDLNKVASQTRSMEVDDGDLPRRWDSGITDNGLIPDGVLFLLIRADTVRFFFDAIFFGLLVTQHLKSLFEALYGAVRCLQSEFSLRKSKGRVCCAQCRLRRRNQQPNPHHVQLPSSLMFLMFRTRLGSSVMFSVHSASAKVLRNKATRPNMTLATDVTVSFVWKERIQKLTHQTLYVLGQKKLASWTAACSFQRGRGAKIVFVTVSLEPLMRRRHFIVRNRLHFSRRVSQWNISHVRCFTLANIQRKLEENFSARERKRLSFRYPQRKETFAGGSTFTRRPFCMATMAEVLAWGRLSWCCFLGWGAPSCGRETSAVIAEPMKEPDDIDEVEVSNVDGACPLHHCDSPGGSENTRCNTHRGKPCLREYYCRHVDRGFLCVIVCGEDMTCHEMTWRDIRWDEITKDDMRWHDRTGHDMTWHDMIWQDRTCHDITWFSPSIQFWTRLLKLSWQLHECALCAARRWRDGGRLGLADTGADARGNRRRCCFTRIGERLGAADPGADGDSRGDRSSSQGRDVRGWEIAEIFLAKLGKPGVAESAGFEPGTVICDWRLPWSWRPFTTALNQRVLGGPEKKEKDRMMERRVCAFCLCYCLCLRFSYVLCALCFYFYFFCFLLGAFCFCALNGALFGAPFVWCLCLCFVSVLVLCAVCFCLCLVFCVFFHFAFRFCFFLCVFLWRASSLWRASLWRASCCASCCAWCFLLLLCSLCSLLLCPCACDLWIVFFLLLCALCFFFALCFFAFALCFVKSVVG